MLLENKDPFRRILRIWRNEDLVEFILQDLHKRVKKDKATKLSVFFTAVSAYLPQPINLFLKGESGIGKSYNVVETLRYFPQDDIWFLGGLSPKALIHDHGVLLNKHGEPIDLMEKPVKPKKRRYKDEAEYREAFERYKEEQKAWIEELQNSYTLIELSHNILVFLEVPEFKTFHMLFPILSHDTNRFEYKFTDKTARGQLKTSKVIIQGWPATIFLSTDRRYMEELATRSFTATPEASKEKIEQANVLTNFKACFPWKYSEETEETKTIRKLILSVRDQLVEAKVDVVVPFANLYELFPKEIVRDMRDFQHFTQFLKTITVLHFYQRAFINIKGKRFLVSTVEDVKQALEIYVEVFETTRTGTEQRILDFYHEIVKAKETWYLGQMTWEYNKNHEKKLSSDSIRKMLKRLSDIGYVDIQKDSEDRRRNVYKPLILKEEKAEIHRVSENPTVLNVKLKKGFKTWRKNIGIPTQFYYYKNLSEKTWGESAITMEEVETIILCDGVFSLSSDKDEIPIILTADSKSKLEKRAGEIGKQEIQHFSANSEELFQCQICRRFGKPMFFVNEGDLELHIQRLHAGYPISEVKSNE